MAINIIHGDCIEGMKAMADNAFDLAIVDPPYGIEMHNQFVRVKPNRPNSYLKAGKSQYKNADWDNHIPDPDYFEELFRVSKNQIIWGANYMSEFIPNGFGWIFWDKQMGDNNFSAGEFAFQSIQKRSACFSYPSMRVSGTRIHPTQKPVALYKWLLHNYAKQGDKILDTHLGSGSIAIACHDYGFDLTGYEIDADYYAAAKKRLEQHQNQLSLWTQNPQ